MARLSQERILQIVRRDGYFFVSPRWRDDPLRKTCFKMCEKGLLKKDHWRNHGKYGNWFLPAKEAEQCSSDQ